MIDGTIARKTKSVSELGARLDTVADSAFVAVYFVKRISYLVVELDYYYSNH